MSCADRAVQDCDVEMFVEREGWSAMLVRFKTVVVVGLFALAAVCFILGYFPIIGNAFWVTWILGCASCVLGLMAAVFVRSGPGSRDQNEGRTQAEGETRSTRLGVASGLLGHDESDQA